MKQLILLLLLLTISCKESKEDMFLANFNDENNKKMLAFVDLNKEIKELNVNVLNLTEPENDFVFNTNKKYFYGHKSKISDDIYLISYGIKYIPIYKPTFYLTNWCDTYLCIYKKNEGILSKIKTSSDDPILSRCKLINNIYTIKSYINTIEVIDHEKENIHYKKDSIIIKYKIHNNRFVEVK